MSEQTHKLLPSEPTINLLISLATRISHIHLKKMKDPSFDIVPDIRELYAFLYASLPEIEPTQTLEELEQEIYENTQAFIPHNVMQWMLKRYINHPQPKD